MQRTHYVIRDVDEKGIQLPIKTDRCSRIRTGLVALSSIFIFLTSLSRRNMMLRIKLDAPTGRFLEHDEHFLRVWMEWRIHIQKHHLQLALVVSSPPIIGPKQVVNTNAPTTTPRYSARFSRGTESPTIQRAP